MKSKIEKRLDNLEKQLQPKERCFCTMYYVDKETKDEAVERMKQEQGITDLGENDYVTLITIYGE